MPRAPKCTYLLPIFTVYLLSFADGINFTIIYAFGSITLFSRTILTSELLQVLHVKMLDFGTADYCGYSLI